MADQTPLHERLQPMTAEQAFNFAYMNPVTARSAVDTMSRNAARMLAAERWHDILERRKGEHEGLPADVERLAARGMRAASEDMRTFAAALVDFAGQAHGAGVLDDVVRFAAAQLADLEEPVNVLAALQEARPLLLGTGVGDEDAWPQDLFEQAIGLLGAGDLTVTGDRDAGTLIFSGAGIDGSHTFTTSAGVLPLLDGPSFLGGRFSELLRSGAGDEWAASGPYATLLGAAAQLQNQAARRARVTATDGVQVTETGIAPLIVVGIVAAVIAGIAGIVLLICALGDLTGGVCAIAATALAVALFVVCEIFLTPLGFDCTFTIASSEGTEGVHG